MDTFNLMDILNTSLETEIYILVTICIILIIIIIALNIIKKMKDK